MDTIFRPASASLPDDVVIEILLRIPANRVYKLCLLSKFCREVIESDDFIQKHYDRSIKVVLMRDKYVRKTESLLNKLDDDVTVRTLFCPNLIIQDAETYFVGCRRGLMCYLLVNKNPTHLAFWNPFTEAFRRSSANADSDLAFRNPLTSPRCLLGYDARTHDFKVLKIKFRLDREGRRKMLQDFAVYSSKTDSWRNKKEEGLNNLGPLDRNYFHGDEVYMDGNNCAHILIEGFKVLAFDFAVEKFNLISLPEHGGFDFEYGLSSLNDCLCFYGCCSNLLNAWIMKEYGVEKSLVCVYSQHLDLEPNGLRMVPFIINLRIKAYSCQIDEGGLKEAFDVMDFLSFYYYLVFVDLLRKIYSFSSSTSKS